MNRKLSCLLIALCAYSPLDLERAAFLEETSICTTTLTLSDNSKLEVSSLPDRAVVLRHYSADNTLLKELHRDMNIAIHLLNSNPKVILIYTLESMNIFLYYAHMKNLELYKSE